jgi:hypothetical protein
MLRQLQGARLAAGELGSGATQIVANLARTPAVVVASIAGPYTFTSSAKVLQIKFDDLVSVTNTFAEATYTAAAAADFLNTDNTFALYAAAFVKTDARGKTYLCIKTKNAGLTGQIEVENVANEAYALLGVGAGAFKEEARPGEFKNWNTYKAAMETAIGTAITNAIKMVKLANKSAGEVDEDDLTAGLPVG